MHIRFLAVFALAAGLCAWAGSARAQTFSRVLTHPGLGLFEKLLAVADLNGDGLDDIFAGGLWEYDAYHAPHTVSPEDRFTKTTLRVFVGKGDGSFRHAPELIQGTIAARSPIVVADDFNVDGRVDLAVFDEGVYVFAVRKGYGNPPQLFLSGPDGRLRPSDALADAVRREHAREVPGNGASGPADLHLKSATSGDIDGDGDIDLWVESNGGRNVASHIMVNNGDGTFTIELARVPYEVLRNPPDYRQYIGNHFVDLDNDGDLELVLGQLSPGPLGLGAPSLVLANDGTGHYPTRIELPRPPFNEGYTRVSWLTHFDVNADGFQDLLLAHRRLYEGPTTEIPDTGRYIQVLINRGGASFDDETPAWMGDQSATTPERDADGNELFNDGAPRMHDVDRDGCADLVMSRGHAPVRTESPLVYRNDGSGQFQAMSPVPFAGSDRYFGGGAVPADVNGDETIDFVVPWHDNGPDGRYGTEDDLSELLTLLNTTPADPGRCRPRVAAVGTLPARTLSVGAGVVVVPLADAFRNASTYQASSSATDIATVSLSGSQVTLTAVAVGVATITVTASGADNSRATQRFRATVLPAAAPLTLDLTCHGYDEGATRAYNCIPEPSQQRHMSTFVPAVGSACDRGSIAEFPAGRIVFQIGCRDSSPGQSAAWSHSGRGPESFVKPIDVPRVWVRTSFSGSSVHLSVWCRAPRENLVVNELLGRSWGNDGTNGIYGMAGCREVEVATGEGEDVQWWFTPELAATALTPPRSWEHVTGAGSALGAEALDDLATAAELERAWGRPGRWLPDPWQGASTPGAVPTSDAGGDTRVDLRIASSLDDRTYALDGGLARNATRTVPLTLDLTCHGYHEGATRAYNCIPEPSQQRHMSTFVPAVGSVCDRGSIVEFPAGRIIFQIRCRDGSSGQSAAWSYSGRGPESFVEPIDTPRVWVRTSFSGNSVHLSVWCRAPRENLVVNELLGRSWGNDGTNGIYGMAGCREVEVATGEGEDVQWWFTPELAATALTPPRSWEHVTGAGSALGAEALDDLATAAELERLWPRLPAVRR